MTIEELVEKLVALQANDDHEFAHIDADDLLLEYINDQRVTEAFNAIDKWYV